MPLFVSTEGYGVLFDCCSLMTFNDEGRESYLFFGYSGSDRLLFHGRQYHGWNYPCLSLFDRQGADAAEVGLWLYPVQGAILYFQRIRGNCTPLQRNRGSAGLCGSGLEHLGSGQLGEKILDQSRYGDNKECMERIHEMHAHSMVSVWPNMNAGGKNHQEFFDAGYLLYDYATYDAF